MKEMFDLLMDASGTSLAESHKKNFFS